MFGGRGMGGGSGGSGGGGMLRNVGRAVTRVGGVYGTTTPPHDPFSSSTLSSSSSSSSTSSLSRKPNSSNNNTPLSLPSSSSVPFLNNNNLISALPFWHSSPDAHYSDWVSVDAFQDDAFSPHSFLGPVPSQTEVERAVSALQQMLGPASHAQLGRDKYFNRLDNELDHVTIPVLVDQVSSDGSETDWAEPCLLPYNSKMLQANGSDRVYYAFHLLRTEPSVQRMVKSLSSDKAVWDAVLNNEVVRELRESIFADEEHVLQSPDGTSNSDSLTTTNVVMWIFDTAKAKFMEVVEKITKIVNELFQPADHKTDAHAEGPDPFNEKLRTTFMLSIMVMLVVIVSRAQARA